MCVKSTICRRKINHESNSDIVNQEVLDSALRIKKQFIEADYFKHVLIKDFLNEGFWKNILKEFPLPPQELKNEFGTLSKKHACHDIVKLGGSFIRWDNFLKSQEFIKYLEKVTGIDDILFDPEYHGAGTHNNLDGQGMDVHIDFNLHRTTGYHRRLNLIIYLNEEWDSDWGGALELHQDPWDVENDRWVTYPCFGNTAILFETNEYSWHGFEKINLPNNQKHNSRKSLTVYYYTKSRPAEEIAPKHGTIYIQKPMPKDIQPGEVLTEEMFENINQIFKHRNGYLKGLYKRESDLLVKIAGLEHRINLYMENFHLPFSGDVVQNESPIGVLPNGKVESSLTVRYVSENKITRISLVGSVPNFVEYNTVAIYLNDEYLSREEVSIGVFEIGVNVDISRGSTIELEFKSLRSVSPFDKNISNDRQSVAFIFHNLKFT